MAIDSIAGAFLIPNNTIFFLVAPPLVVQVRLSERHVHFSYVNFFCLCTKIANGKKVHFISFRIVCFCLQFNLLVSISLQAVSIFKRFQRFPILSKWREKKVCICEWRIANSNQTKLFHYFVYFGHAERKKDNRI